MFRSVPKQPPVLECCDGGEAAIQLNELQNGNDHRNTTAAARSPIPLLYISTLSSYGLTLKGSNTSCSQMYFPKNKMGEGECTKGEGRANK